MQAYMALLPYANLSGPTTWAPAIYKALEIVKRSNGRYHILVIISDGQVNEGRWEAETKQAIITASYFPLSIIMVCCSPPFALFLCVIGYMPKNRKVTWKCSVS